MAPSEVPPLPGGQPTRADHLLIRRGSTLVVDGPVSTLLSRGIALAAGLHALRVDARGAFAGQVLLLAAVVDVEDVECVDMAWYVSACLSY